MAIPDGLISLIEGGEVLAVCEKTAVVRALPTVGNSTPSALRLCPERVPPNGASGFHGANHEGGVEFGTGPPERFLCGRAQRGTFLARRTQDD